ncbi:hypothetical protein ASPSYDRAFT_498942 [Aspergillus sydowii CBS 593.65]|uniref:Uncharacterized protein n=1 Tax=Aspergillus sydowii CBS 593.65 TaxID=1036612 RepID=A0A1L9T4M8_9EURO|nr:uncharacterized protein ASPSYDRAFT_498942 [Aspergillus sydowii CBS 593.65]OJJ54392.1 hypothetical protein ASPSYDRAFT_498942 [Aspergillus sydowii CBS 593.65]
MRIIATARTPHQRKPSRQRYNCPVISPVPQHQVELVVAMLHGAKDVWHYRKSPESKHFVV